MSGRSLSLCLIVKNEECNIVNCIKSFECIVDDVVVLDTGSNDHTKALALKNGASVFDFEWTGSFSDARNKCLEYVKTDWCLFVDADERLDSYDPETLDCLMKEVEAIYVRVKTNQDEIEKLKIWKLSAGLKYKLPVHEFLDVGDVKVGVLDDFVIKNESFVDMEKIRLSRKRYIGSLENYYKNNMKYLDRVYFYLCADSFFVEDYKRSYEYGFKYLNLNLGESYFLGKIHYYLGEIELLNGNLKSAKDHIEKAYDILGDLNILHEAYSHILYTLGDKKGAIEYYKKLHE